MLLPAKASGEVEAGVADEATVSDCNARSTDGCLCMDEQKAISLVAEVRVCRRLQPQTESGWLVGLLALAGALLGNVARGALGLERCDVLG